MSKAEAGNALSMVAAGLIVGSPLLSHLSDKVFRARKPVLLLATAAVVGVTALLAFRAGTLSVPMLYLACFGIGFTGSLMVLGFTMTKELYPVSIAGTALGLVNIFPFTGGAVFQIVLGSILERYGRTGEAFTLAGYEHAFLALFGCAVLAFLFGLCTRETLAR
jgi:MFS family permease